MKFYLFLLPVVLHALLIHTAALPPLSRRVCQSSLRDCPEGIIIVSKSHPRAHFSTALAAIESLPNDESKQIILIQAGSYTEQLNVTRTGPITLLGQTDSANHDNTGKSVDNVFSSVLVVAPTLVASYTGSGPTGYPVPEDTPFGNVDFRVYNIDFRNTWADYSDGPAHASSLSRANGGFYSYQDTVYVGKLGNAYFYKNIIAGQTDFLYGFVTAWVQSSDVLLRNCGGGITATACTSYSTVNAANASIAPTIAGKCALGRPWNSLHRSIFANGYEDGSIQPSGYIDWVVSGVSRFSNDTVMAEYKAFGPRSQRHGPQRRRRCDRARYEEVQALQLTQEGIPDARWQARKHRLD
ncbi:putative pectin methylesterase [Aspergillus clavatus NRRL 1]|uniref:pectinesterase n=1 Tax=Aspergillus clavatus (strain ATCC 1007 / CBS 513.65 / DSM 816 / NCTC 3887 / NRRL 1 / QM 1276 / 107) TaxID=344612 RepID=A1CJN4_ASPCL|nr:pectin methylesterase, putative [Aspergillus clavatus NRRL 1]EAW09358.1 pectin methylesterase, putative [Aspergillus clavatus NRRL 1]